MKFWTALGVAAITLAAAPVANDDVFEFKKSDVDKLVKNIRKYYASLDADMPGKAYGQLDGIRAILEKAVPKGATWDVTLSMVPDWREIMRRGNLPEKPSIKSGSSRISLRPMDFSSPLRLTEDEQKALGPAFDGKLKVIYSIPRNYKTKPHPVILVLHPSEEEVNVKTKEMKKSTNIVKEVKEWAEDTYPKEVLDNAILAIPVLDACHVNPDGLTASRVLWDSSDGALWAFSALRDVVLNGISHDPSRIFVDGHGSGSKAAMTFCSQFPSLLTGGVVRGAPAQRVEFRNCRGQSFVFVGDEAKSFSDTWAQKEGYRISHMDELGPADLIAWLGEETTTKGFLPEKVEIRAEGIPYASAYWLRINGFARVDNIRAAEIIGEVDREANQITVTTNPKVSGFTIYLNDDLLDLDKEITVIHKEAGAEEGTIKFQGTKKRSLESILQEYYYRNHGNYGEIYVQSIEVEL